MDLWMGGQSDCWWLAVHPRACVVTDGLHISFPVLATGG